MNGSKQLGGDVLILDDGSYPALLREIDDPPPVLYVKGDWQACFEQPCVGVIGSRMCSTYGENASEMLARDLASRGITIVSGLARGIDSAAHRGAIRGQGKTIAVMGTGIDSVYPKENNGLVREILASGGCLVSQFPLGTPPIAENFPYRNRIISGLSLGVLIVEASESSGSLITARLAMEQNREVMAVPGNITSGNSFGTNYLIKSGAKLVQQWQDVVAELPSEISAAILPPKIEKPETAERQPELIPADMSENEQKIWNILTPDEPTHIDILLESSGLSFGDLNNALVSLDYTRSDTSFTWQTLCAADLMRKPARKQGRYTLRSLSPLLTRGLVQVEVDRLASKVLLVLNVSTNYVADVFFFTYGKEPVNS